jgi:thiaminase
MASRYLRRGVRVSRGAETVSVRHSFWALNLPASWIAATPGMDQFLAGQLSAMELLPDEPELGNLLALLEAQGCLSYPDDRDVYTLRQVRELFEQISASWYGQYYSHPLWDRLRDGSLSRDALLAWLLHTYHLSRSVGMSASRSATYLPTLMHRALFARSALEEYSHCETFFFVRHPSLAITDEQVRRVVPLPSNVAFDQQMLRMAEIDWLGHVLSALFQETTARFYDQVREFHRTVAAAYELGDYFRNWERHVQIDLTEGHASEFNGVLDSDHQCARRDLVASLRNTWFTFQFLLGALDEILEVNASDARAHLRMPLQAHRLSPETTALLEPYRESLPKDARIEASSALELAEWLEQLDLNLIDTVLDPSEAKPIDQGDLDFLAVDVTQSIYRAMSFATEHGEILLLGRLAEDATATFGSIDSLLGSHRQPVSPHSMALANFLREGANRPVWFAFLLRHAITTASASSLVGEQTTWIPVSSRSAAPLDDFLAAHQLQPLERDILLTKALQLNELMGRWVTLGWRASPVDFFRD